MIQADTVFKTLDAERRARSAAGVTSPLWFPFMAAASAGVAFWWMTGWSRHNGGLLPFGAETKSFAPTADLAPAANDFEVAAVEASAPLAEPEPAPLAVEKVAVVDAVPAALAEMATVVTHAAVEPEAAPTPRRFEAAHEHRTATTVEAADPLAEAEAAFTAVQDDVARLAAEAATAELAVKPRRAGKKA